jgi:hypothetical protein
MKIDVSVCLYGKPYHTALAIKSLLKHCQKHIDKIYVTVEKKQPQNDTDSHIVLKDLLKDIDCIEYFYPKEFYNLRILNKESLINNQEERYSVPYQYVLEKSDKDFVFVMHNDCLFHGDMIGHMIDIINNSKEPLTGVGPIGQCWNCPAAFAKLCNGAIYDQFKPSQEEALRLINEYKIPVYHITERLISEGRYYPMPECRLNEYASLINTQIYRETSLPLGKNVTYAGAWGGCDWGTVWFYEMVNQGFKFKHVTLEEFATHAPFNPVGNGISAYSRKDLYFQSEEKAKNHLKETFGIDEFSASTKINSQLNKSFYFLKSVLLKIYLKIMKLVKG